MINLELPKIELNKLKAPKNKIMNKILKFLKFLKGRSFRFVLIILVSSFFGFLAGTISVTYFSQDIKDYLNRLNIELPISSEITEKECLSLTSQEEMVIKVVNEASRSVVSIIVTKDLPVFEEFFYSPFEEFKEFFGQPFFEFEIPQYRQKGTEKREIGGGTGFIISEEGMILTNAHVVSEPEAEYTVLTNDGKKYPARVLARDTLRDLAILKIENKEKFPILKLGNSDKLQIGQSVIAIGNALGEFRNTVSVGVISGLGRTITASGEGIIETIEDVIQTDAAINRGNSGGPLLNLRGEVIGVNFAMAQTAENIGFAIPINKAKKDIEQVKTLGKISYPFLGVRYVLINEKIQKDNNLSVDYGAWIIKGIQGEPAVSPASPAEKAGLKENDIILEFNGEKITLENSLAKIILKYNPGDKAVLKILRNSQEKIIEVILGERSD